MTATIHSSFAVDFGTEDAMETAADLDTSAHELDEIEIDSDFGDGPANALDEDMTPADEVEDLPMPVDHLPDDQNDEDLHDAPMDTYDTAQPSLIEEPNGKADIDLPEAEGGGQDKDDTTIEEDLLDETDDAISDSAQPEPTKYKPLDYGQDEPQIGDSIHLPPDNTQSRGDEGTSMLNLDDSEQAIRASSITKIESLKPTTKTSSDDASSILKHGQQAENLSRLNDPHITEDHARSSPVVEASQEVHTTEYPSQPLTHAEEDIQGGVSSSSNISLSALHPVYVIYQEQEMPLFQQLHPNTECSETFLLPDSGLARSGLLDLLSACRDVLQEDLDENEELEIAIEDLGLKIRESSSDFPPTTLVEIVDLFISLHRNDGNLEPPPLYLYLYSVTDYSRWWDHLLSLEAEGTGISAILTGDGVKEETSQEDVDEPSNSQAFDDDQAPDPPLVVANDAHLRQQSDPGNVNVNATSPDHERVSVAQTTTKKDSPGSSASTPKPNLRDEEGLGHDRASSDASHHDVLRSISESAPVENPDVRIGESPAASINGLLAKINEYPPPEDSDLFTREGINEGIDAHDTEQSVGSKDQDQAKSSKDDDLAVLGLESKVGADDSAHSLLRSVVDDEAREKDQPSIHAISDEIEDQGIEIDLEEESIDIGPVDRPNASTGEPGLYEDDHDENRSYNNIYEIDDVGIVASHDTESGDPNVDGNLTDTAVHESSTAITNQAESETSPSDAEPANDEVEATTEEIDWDFEATSAPDLTLKSSPRSLKRARSWKEDDGDDFDQRDEQAKRSRAS